MLYTKQQLEAIKGRDEENVATQRYLHKVGRGEYKKLLPHELDFITLRLPSIYTEKDCLNPAFNIFEIEYCAEPLFRRLILTYFENLDFLKPVSIGYRNLNDAEIARDREKFHELVGNWNSRLQFGSGDAYLHEVKIEYNRKTELLNITFKNGIFGGRHLHERELLKQKLAAFYIYHLTKVFFRSHRINHVTFQVFGATFTVNIYSYVHIVSRHYIPKLNGIDTEKSFNEEITCIDPFNLPYSIRDLIVDYAAKAPADYILNPEFMIFSQDTSFYIIWWKHKKLNDLKFQFGYEVRTLYKIEAERDKKKINHNNFYQLNDRIKYFY